MMHNILDWNKVSLKDKLDILTGYSFSSKQFNKEKGLPLIRIRDLLTHNPVTKYDGEYKDTYLINKGDILIGMDGEFNIVKWKGPKALLNQRVAKIKSKNSMIIDNQFIYYKMFNELKQIESLTPATTVKHLAKKDIQNLNLLLPPIEEQQKIASILSSVDEAIEKTKQIVERTNVALKELTSQLIVRGVNHKDYKTTKLGQIPKIWELNTLQEVSENKNGMRRGPFGGALRKDIFVSSGYAIYEQQHVIHNTFDNIRYFITEEKFKEMQNFEVRTDDILISCSGTVGKVALVPQNSKPGIINQALLRIRIKSEILDINYAYYLLSSNIMHNKMTEMSHGSTLKNIVSIKQLKQILVPIPPLKEQNEIVNILDSIHLKLQAEREKLKNLESIKKGLMQQLLTGKIRVPLNENEEVPQ